MTSLRHSPFTIPNSLFPRAFTLVEVLASIAILAVVLPIIMSGLSLATNASSIAKRRAQATSLAQAKLNELIVTRDFQAPSGDFADYPDYRWTASVEAWNSGTTDGLTSSIDQLQVSVTWKQRGREYNATLSTLLCNTASSDPFGGLLP